MAIKVKQTKTTTVTHTKKSKSGGNKGQNRCPTCGKFMKKG